MPWMNLDYVLRIAGIYWNFFFFAFHKGKQPAEEKQKFKKSVFFSKLKK